MKILIGDMEVDLQEDNLKFNEATLNEFLKNEGALYSYYAEMHSRATMIHAMLEDEYEQMFSQKFAENKEGLS